MIGVIIRKDFKHTMARATPRFSGGAVPQASTHALLSFFLNNHLFHHITCANGINDIQTFIYLAKYSVVSVEVGGRRARVTDEEL